MALLLYYVSKQVGIFMSFCSLVASVISLVATLAASHRQQERNTQKGGSHSQHQLAAVFIICIIMVVLSFVVFICLLFFDYRGMEPIEVPSVDGLSYAEALECLQSNNLLEKVICEDQSEDWSNYIVMDQRPAAGEMVLTKTRIKLFLAPAEIQPESPDVQNENPVDTPLVLSSIVLSADTEFSEVSITPSSAYSGDSVELHISGINNYGFDLTLIDRNGNELLYEREDWGIFNFIMPDNDVTVYLTSLTNIPDEPSLPNTICKYGLFDCPTCGFTDLDPNAWYHDAVDFVVSHEILSGYENEFLPDGTFTRAEIASLFCKLAGWPIIPADNQFTDVPETAWYAAAVNWAANQEIIDGYSDRTFRPNDLVTVEQFITILWKYADSPINNQVYPEFYDEDEISQYAADAVEWAAGEGFLRFTNSVLNPQRHISRIEAAEILKNYIGS